MFRPRPFRPAVDGAIALGAVVYATAPTWRMGWLRDDWLQLWAHLDPGTAPAGAGGVFPRPVAGLLWAGSVAVAGDRPWALHAFVFLAWLALVAGTLRWHRAFGGGHGGALVVALALAGHGALVEPRLWAAAANGVLAAALAVWGGVLLSGERNPVVRAGGVALVVLAVLARADAVVLLVLPAVAAAVRARRGAGPFLVVPAVAGLAALAWMVAAGGGWSARPADAGHLLRLLFVPWGPPLPGTAAAGVGVAGVLAAVVLGRFLVAAAPRAAALLLAAGAVAVAGALVDWTAAGRYVMMPAVTLALALGAWWDRCARGGRPGPGCAMGRIVVGAWIVLGLVAVPAGRSGRDLRARSAHETALYEALRRAGPPDAARLLVVDPPPMGWSGAAADVENVASTALRRPVAVTLTTGAADALTYPAALWRDGAWRIVTAASEP